MFAFVVGAKPLLQLPPLYLALSLECIQTRVRIYVQLSNEEIMYNKSNFKKDESI